MVKNKEITKEMNKLLKGLEMGKLVFTPYQSKAKNIDIKNEITRSIFIFREQEDKIASYIKKLNGEVDEDLGFTGKISSIYEKMKNIFIENDKELLEHIIDGVDMGIINLKTFINTYEEDIKDTSIIHHLYDMLSQYESMKSRFIVLYKGIRV